MRKSTIKRTAAVVAATGCAAAFLIVATGATSGNWIVEPSKVSPALSYSYTTAATTAAQTTAITTTAAQTTRGGGGGGGSSSEPPTSVASTTDVSATTATPSAVTTTAAEPAPLPRGGSGGNDGSPGTATTAPPSGSAGVGENTTYGGIIGDRDPNVTVSDAGGIVSPVPSATTTVSVNADEPGTQLPPHTGVGSVAAVPFVLATAVVLIVRGRKRG